MGMYWRVSSAIATITARSWSDGQCSGSDPLSSTLYTTQYVTLQTPYVSNQILSQQSRFVSPARRRAKSHKSPPYPFHCCHRLMHPHPFLSAQRNWPEKPSMPHALLTASVSPILEHHLLMAILPLSGCAAGTETMTHFPLTLISANIPLMNATNFPVFCTLTPMCQSEWYPGAVRDQRRNSFEYRNRNIASSSST
jgi:hypothetical protein